MAKVAEPNLNLQLMFFFVIAKTSPNDLRLLNPTTSRSDNVIHESILPGSFWEAFDQRVFLNK